MPNIHSVATLLGTPINYHLRFLTPEHPELFEKWTQQDAVNIP